MIYEYVCEHCNHKCEMRVSMKEKDNDCFCEQCSNKLIRLISKDVLFNLKGEGFYKAGMQ